METLKGRRVEAGGEEWRFSPGEEGLWLMKASGRTLRKAWRTSIHTGGSSVELQGGLSHWSLGVCREWFS